MANFVQDYRSTDLNAPGLSGQVAAGTVLFDAVLINGYGLTNVAITSITRSGATATATIAAVDMLRLQTGHILTIAGATGADASLYNITATITAATATTFTYTMAGTPTGSATGTLTFDNLLRITGITRSGATATATLLNANATLRTGHYVVMGGSTQPEYNGTVQITVVDGTHFSYAVTGTPTTPATTSTFFSYYKAGLGWSTAFTGTNLRAYRSLDAVSNQFYLRVDDTPTYLMNMRGYEVMTDVNTGTGPFPTAVQITNGCTWYQSNAAGATQIAWFLCGDDRSFFFAPTINFQLSLTPVPCFFGHFIPYKPGDAYNTLLSDVGGAVTGGGNGFFSICGDAVLWASTGPAMVANCGGYYIARPYTQIIGAHFAQAFDARTPTTASNVCIGGASAGIVYPNGPDSGLWVGPLFVTDFTGSKLNMRGRFPGIYIHQHNSIPQNQYDLVTGVVGLAGSTLMAINVQSTITTVNVGTGQWHIDVTGPW